jgi:hypothetical protein
MYMCNFSSIWNYCVNFGVVKWGYLDTYAFFRSLHEWCVNGRQYSSSWNLQLFEIAFILNFVGYNAWMLGNRAPYILDLGTTHRCVVCFYCCTPREHTPVAEGQEANWAPELAQTCWQEVKCVGTGSPAIQTVTTHLTRLCRLILQSIALQRWLQWIQRSADHLVHQGFSNYRQLRTIS